MYTRRLLTQCSNSNSNSCGKHLTFGKISHLPASSRQGNFMLNVDNVNKEKKGHDCYLTNIKLQEYFIYFL